MRNVYKYNQDNKANVCAGHNCITVYGDTAQFIKAIAIVATIASAVILIDKAIR